MAASPDFGASAQAGKPAWRARVESFWRWWMGELAQAMPERLSALRGAARLPQVALGEGELVLVEPRSMAGPDARVALHTLDGPRARAAVRAVLERAGETRGRVRLRLAPHEALVRRVTMPAATEENLAQVLAFEMDRLTPFRADEVYFDHRVVGRDAAAATLAVQLAVSRRDIVDARVQALRDLGLSVQGVGVADDLAPGAPLDLLPSEQRGERESARERILRMGLLLLVVLLLAATLIWPVWRKRQAVIALLPQMARAAEEAQATDKIARDLERQVEDYNFLLGKKHGSLPALAYVEDVSRLLPDNTWVQQLDLKQVGKTREVQITGETPSSSRLIEIFQQSQLLQNPSTRGTVTRGSQPGTERFMIAAETKARAAPEPRPVLEGAEAAKAPPAANAPAQPPAANAPGQQPPPGAPAKAPAAPPTPAKVQPAPPPAAPKADPKAPPKAAPGK